MLLDCTAKEDSGESFRLRDHTSQSYRKSTLNIYWKDWCWSWKDPDAGKIQSRKGRGQQTKRWLDGIPRSWTWVWANSCLNRGASCAAVQESTKIWIWISDWKWNKLVHKIQWANMKKIIRIGLEYSNCWKLIISTLLFLLSPHYYESIIIV